MFLVAVTREPAPYPELAVEELDDASDDEQKPLLADRAKETERVIGTAHWSRMAPASRFLSRITLLDVRPSVVGSSTSSQANLSVLLVAASQIPGSVVNQAADPAKEDIIEQSYDFLDHIWTAENHRSPCWYLECLAVRPEYQKCGVGRELVKWGLGKAEEEGICCSVISALGRERFYQECGFDVGPVGWSWRGRRESVGGRSRRVDLREGSEKREGGECQEERRPREEKDGAYGGKEVEFV